MMTIYRIDYSSRFKSEFKKIKRQGKDLEKFYKIVDRLSKKEKLELKYRNHLLKDDNLYKNCYECHIEPDWLLIYKYDEDTNRLILYSIGSHSDLFQK